MVKTINQFDSPDGPTKFNLFSKLKNGLKRNSRDLTDLYSKIENYCQLNLGPKNQEKAEAKIKKILEKIKHRKICSV